MISAMQWNDIEFWPAALVIVAALTALVLWVYPSQVQILPRFWAVTLMGLRITVLAVLASTMLKPSIKRDRSADEYGAVVMIVDNSKSMSIVDTHRSSAQLVALADGLGLLPAGLREDPIAGLAIEVQDLRDAANEVIQAHAEREYAGLSGRNAELAQQHLDSALEEFERLRFRLIEKASSIPKRMRLPERLNDLSEIRLLNRREAWARDVFPRIERLAAAVDQFEAPSDERLMRDNPQVREICDRLKRMSRFELVELAMTNPGTGILHRVPRDTMLFGFAAAKDLQPIALHGEAPVRQLTIQPSGDASDLSGALHNVQEQLRGMPVQAVVLLSDGRQVGGEPATPTALAGLTAPVISIAAAHRWAPPDLAIGNVIVADTAFVGETVTVRAEIRAPGFSGRAVDVIATAGNARSAKNIMLSDRPQIVEFPLKLDEPGAQEIEVSIPERADETSADNNTATRHVKVLSNKVKLSFYAGTPSWDYRFIRNALLRAPSVDLHDAIIAQGQKLSLSPDEILELDGLILSDIQPEMLDSTQWDALNRLVVERGGSVVILIGDDALPARYAENVVLNNLLPVTSGSMPTFRVWPGEEPVFKLIPAADDLEALRLASDRGTSLQLWHALPAIYRFLPLTSLKPNVKPLLVERESGAAVLTESRVGAGRVFFIGVNETWRWRSKEGENLHDRLWLQLLRYACEEPYAVVDGELSLDADRVSIAPNESVNVRVRVRGTDGALAAKDHVEVQVVQDGVLQHTVELKKTDAQSSGRFSGTISTLPAAQYEIVLSHKDQTLRLPLLVAESSERELADISGDEPSLRRWSSATGGQMLRLDELHRLPSLLSEIHRRQPQTIEVSLWDSPYLFLFVLAGLSIEWALRKRLGLA